MKKIIWFLTLTLLFSRLAYGGSNDVHFSSPGGGSSDPVEGTAILSTGEEGGNKYLREDGDGTSSWQTVEGGAHDALTLSAGAGTMLTLSTQELQLDSTLGDTEIFVGSGAGTGAYVAVSGDITMGNDGVTVLGADKVKDSMVDWGTGAGQVSAVDIPIADSGSHFTGEEVETALQEIYPAFASGTVGSSGVSLIGINTYTGDVPNMQTFVNGTQSSQLYSGGVISENAALDGTIDITEIVGYIKGEADNESFVGGSFTIAASSANALSTGANFINVTYNSGTPILSITTIPPNFSNTFAFAIVYKDVNSHLHISQGISNYLGLPYKTNSRFSEHDGTVRTSGLVVSEGTENFILDITAGSIWRGLTKISASAYDGDSTCDITGDGTVSANNTIVLDSGCGDLTDTYVHGLEIYIDDSSNTNNGAYHVQSSSWDATNTTVVLEETSLNTGNDTGHVHPTTFTYWHYRLFDTTWVETNQAGDHVSIIIDNAYYNDITDADNGDELKALTSNRYGTAFVYRSATDDARVHVVYGQGDYTLTQAIEVGVPGTLPTLVNSMAVLIAKIVYQEGATDFYEIYYPWETTFSSTGAGDHGGLAGLGDDDHTQYGALAQAETIAGNWVNTDNPWADNEVSDTLTASVIDLEAGTVTNIADTEIMVGVGAGDASYVVISGDVTLANDGTVTIGNEKIDSDMYIDGSIDEAHMSANSIDSDSYVDGSIDEVHMSANSIDSDSYVDGSIDEAHMSANSIDSDSYVDGSIDLAHMSSSSVDSDNIVDNTIANADMADNSIDSDDYVDASIDNAHLADNAVDSAEINTNAVKLDALDVSDVSDNIAGDIAEGELADSIIVSADIKADTITNADIDDADQTVTFGIWFEDPVATDDFKSIWANKTANDFIITEIWAESDGDIDFDLQVDDGSPADVNGADVEVEANEVEDTSMGGDATVAAGEELDLVVTAVDDTPTWVSIMWTGNWVD